MLNAGKAVSSSGVSMVTSHYISTPHNTSLQFFAITLVPAMHC